MRLGLFGGTFDPVHVGHLILAEQCREQCGLDEVRFIPAGKPPHKDDSQLTPGAARAEMLEFATAGFAEFRVDRRELKREGKSFTVDTLQELDDEDPQRELFFLIGADSLRDLPAWREPQRIIELATLVVCNRGDRPLPDLDAARQHLGRPGAEIRLATMPGIDLSSTDLRQRIREGTSIRFMTPRAVEAYIREHHLYGDTTAADGM